MTVYAKVDTYGSIIADMFKLKNSGDIDYDKA